MGSGSFACIADANIFIDFSEAGILQMIMRAGFSLTTTDLIVAEMETPSLSDLQYIGISIVSLDGKSMLRLSELRIDFQKPSIADLSALVAAEHLNTILLTGDAALRRAAAGIGVEVHGTIWLMNNLVQKQALPRAEAEQLLDKMRHSGRRLPPYS